MLLHCMVLHSQEQKVHVDLDIKIRICVFASILVGSHNVGMLAVLGDHTPAASMLVLSPF